jgi:hypothetical protein
MPTELDTLQVTKYVVRRMREWGRTDVAGVSLVNHQRSLPGLERDHQNAFTQQQVEDAAQNGTALMTTWDLFRLVRGMTQWAWPPQAVRDVLYGVGRLPAYPSHYRQVGTVAHYWTDKSVVSIDVTAEGLKVGGRVGYLLADGFFEEEVGSLQVSHSAVQEAPPGKRVGMKTKLGRREIPVGTAAFVVGSTDS